MGQRRAIAIDDITGCAMKSAHGRQLAGRLLEALLTLWLLLSLCFVLLRLAPGGPFDAELFVQPVDLSNFGVALGESVRATQVSGSPQLDLIRVAGFLAVPEPSTIALFGVGILAYSRRRFRR